MNNINKFSQRRIAVIGLGYWGQKLAAELVKLGQEVVAVDLTNLKSVYKFQQLTWSAVLATKNISAVVIATPEITHAALIKQALLAGKAVFVEKPAATNFNDWQELADLALNKQLPIVVDYTFLQSQAVLAWKQLQRKNSQNLGQLVKLVSVRHSQLEATKILAKKLPVWWDVAIHDIYLVRSIWKKNLASWRIQTDDPFQTAKIFGKFGLVLFEGNYSWSENPARTWRAEYEKGQLVWTRNQGQEILEVFVSGNLIERLNVNDNYPSPLERVLTDWLIKINSTSFIKNDWQNYFEEIGGDIKMIAEIDLAS